MALTTLRDAHKVAEGVANEDERAEAMRYLVFAGCKVMEKGAAVLAMGNNNRISDDER